MPTKLFRQPFTNDWPITQRYGEALTSSFHTGIDYGCPIGTTILASGEGTVVFAGWDNTGYGNLVIVKHDWDHSTLYAHLSLVSVKVGQSVRQGEKIGESGTSGNSTGPHLHFEARRTWNDYKSHFNPIYLPLQSVDDSYPEPETELVIPKEGNVRISAPSGAFGHGKDFLFKSGFPIGTKFSFSGKTVERNGLTFCECSVWIAAHDGETQILENW